MIVLVGVEKGGTGKTTTATNLAIEKAREGLDVLLVDCDPQGAATNFNGVRKSHFRDPEITVVRQFGITTGVEIARLRNKFDHIIIDAGGADSVELRSSMVVCDKLVMPIRPAQFDIWTLAKMEQLTMDAWARGNSELTPIVVMNAVSTNPVLYREEVELPREALREFEKNFMISKILIHERVAFKRAAKSGCSVAELAEGDSSKAIDEIMSLKREVFDE